MIEAYLKLPVSEQKNILHTAATKLGRQESVPEKTSGFAGHYRLITKIWSMQA